MSARKWNALNRQIIQCDRCPRLRDHCSQVAEKKRKAYLDWDYWGKPVPNFGAAAADLLIVGLAPGAHGANRTGRMFTGDRSGEWLYRALHRAGFANQTHSEFVDDGLQLINCAITAVCHCAPPANKPTRDEVVQCEAYLEQTFQISSPRAVLALGQLAWKATFDELVRTERYEGSRPKFGHGQERMLPDNTLVIGSYHVSQQNTFTGRLTEAMLDAVFTRINEFLAHV